LAGFELAAFHGVFANTQQARSESIEAIEDGGESLAGGVGAYRECADTDAG
jgi:hypothetical protein